MPNSQQYTSYLNAKLKCYKSGSMIEYYVENPQTNKLCRKTIKVNRIMERHKYKKDAIKQIDSMITAINAKLASGYNPFFDGEDARLYTPMREVFGQFLKEKEKESRPDTMRSYKSFINQFHKFIIGNSNIQYISIINHSLVARYMDYCYNTRNNSVTTYNNQIKMGRAFFNWCMDKYFTKGNPFDKIKTKKKQPKKRTIIDPQTRTLIQNHLKENNDKFLIVCKLMYYSLIRPKEIAMIKIKHIDLKNHFIFIPGENAKNHNSRFASLTPDLVNELQYIYNYNPDYYLFAASYLPGEKHQLSHSYTKKWERLRKLFNLNENMQLYSFKDTGIFEMLKKGIDDLSVMQHADHHSLDMTTVYGNHHDPNLTKKIYENAPEF